VGGTRTNQGGGKGSRNYGVLMIKGKQKNMGGTSSGPNYRSMLWGKCGVDAGQRSWEKEKKVEDGEEGEGEYRLRRDRFVEIVHRGWTDGRLLCRGREGRGGRRGGLEGQLCKKMGGEWRRAGSVKRLH